MKQIENPYPLFVDTSGRLMDGGMIYVGVANSDPQANPIDCYFDVELTSLAEQPVRTVGGVIVNGTIPSRLFTAQDDYSIRICDHNGVQVSYVASSEQSDIYQPKNVDLTAIANSGTTPFGRTLLALNSQADLKNATGIGDPLLKSGGIVTGDIQRSGAGNYVYCVDPTLSGREFFTAPGASNPMTRPGDKWFVVS